MIFKKRVILPFFLILLISNLTFAADKDIVTLQGVVMDLDLRKNLMFVNERAIGWNQNTLICNEKGSPIPVDKLTTKTWVYIEGVKDEARKRVMAKKIYLLPKYIDGNEKNLYPFIK
jgi:hypothetical protein